DLFVLAFDQGLAVARVELAPFFEGLLDILADVDLCRPAGVLHGLLRGVGAALLLLLLTLRKLLLALLALTGFGLLGLLALARLLAGLHLRFLVLGLLNQAIKVDQDALLDLLCDLAGIIIDRQPLAGARHAVAGQLNV